MCAVHNMTAFCSSLISCFPAMLLRCSLTDFEVVPVAPTITGITFVLIYYFYFKVILVYQLSGGGFPVNPDLNNRSKQFTPALSNPVCSAH